MTASAGAWQPIESAPRDGSAILLFLPDSAYCPIVIGEWQDDVSLPDGGAWWERAAEPPPFSIDVEATMWAPLYPPVSA